MPLSQVGAAFPVSHEGRVDDRRSNLMQKTFRELTNEEIMLVAGGLDSDTVIVIGGGGGGGGGWGDGGPPSDPWGGGGAPNDPADGGIGGDGGGVGDAGINDGTTHHYTIADVNHDGRADEHFYQRDDGNMYYSVKDANGQQYLYPVTQMSGTVGNGATASSNFGATGGVPTAGITYTETTSNGVISFQINPQGARKVQ